MVVGSKYKYRLYATLLGKSIYSRTSVAQTPWNRENIIETRIVRANEC